jgi:hypothetical protein
MDDRARSGARYGIYDNALARKRTGSVYISLDLAADAPRRPTFIAHVSSFLIRCP